MKRASTSLRQPLLIYALLFSGAVATIVLTLAAVSMVQASRRAYRRAVEAQAGHLSQLTPEEIGRVAETKGAAAVHWRIEGVRAEAAEHRVAVPLRDGRQLVGEFDPTVPTSIAFVEVSRIFPLAVVSVLGLAWLFAVMTGRLFFSPLRGLAEVAEQSEPVAQPPHGLAWDDDANEIVDIARRFRQTIDRLSEERQLLAEQKAELERMQEALIRTSKLASVGRLAAGIAHEVGNPLAAVRGYLGLLRGGLDPAEQTEVVHRSQGELERIHETIRKLLAYARSGEQADAALEATDLAEVVRSALFLARGHPALQTVQVEAELPSLPKARAHPERLGQVVFNLVLNGAQAAGSGGHVRITGDCPGAGRVRLWVQDDGPGVPRELAEQIFDPFFTTKEPGEGTGLGLAVCRAMVDTMGGDVRLGDSPQGARFEVELPAWELPSTSQSD
jgi:two-component system, NtrC family, sensor kinase